MMAPKALNWLECGIVECRPGKLSGAPFIRGTRVRPEDVISNVDLAPEEIADNFELRLENVREVLDFYQARQAMPRSRRGDRRRAPR